MKTFNKIALLSLVILSFVSLSCNNDDSSGSGSVTLEFNNTVGIQPLSLNIGAYVNGSDETYTISELKYILSDVVLVKENGGEFVYPKAASYFLVNEEDSNSKSFTLENVPAGNYTAIKFGFGVDQSNYPLNGIANFVPKAEEAGMLWSWSAGYKFIKFEGSYTPEGGTQDTFLYHVGSHGATLDNYKTITLDLSSANVSDGGNTTIGIEVDISKIFDGTHTMSLANKDDIQVDPVNAPLIAENITTMFSAITILEIN
ncbi:MbnP family protein [Sungkyunkwania multivorans]|uniref:MbnP family protein n=1 Tax=Sungkyunkwania multivorans TaxID=1173618 RepID=A0ABW3D0C7_9FLAO